MPCRREITRGAAFQQRKSKACFRFIERRHCGEGQGKLGVNHWIDHQGRHLRLRLPLSDRPGCPLRARRQDIHQHIRINPQQFSLRNSAICSLVRYFT